jgi:hypothetical protein
MRSRWRTGPAAGAGACAGPGSTATVRFTVEGARHASLPRWLLPVVLVALGLAVVVVAVTLVRRRIRNTAAVVLLVVAVAAPQLALPGRAHAKVVLGVGFPFRTEAQKCIDTLSATDPAHVMDFIKNNEYPVYIEPAPAYSGPNFDLATGNDQETTIYWDYHRAYHQPPRGRR